MRPVAETPAPLKCRRAVSDNIGRRESSRPQLRRGALGTTGVCARCRQPRWLARVSRWTLKRRRPVKASSLRSWPRSDLSTEPGPPSGVE